jgi:endonuclease I
MEEVTDDYYLLGRNVVWSCRIHGYLERMYNIHLQGSKRNKAVNKKWSKPDDTKENEQQRTKQIL